MTDMSSLQPILDVFVNQGVFVALFIWLFISTSKDNKERESKLMLCVERQTIQLQEISNTLENINNRIDKIECKIEK